jgi:hypothetical protein
MLRRRQKATKHHTPLSLANSSGKKALRDSLRKIAAFVEECEIKIEMEKVLLPLTYASLGNVDKMREAEDIVAAMIRLADFNACLSGEGVGVPLPSKIHRSKAMAVLKMKIKLKSKEVMCIRKEVQAIQAAKRADEEHRSEGGQAIFARQVCHRSQLQSISTRRQSDNTLRSHVISCRTYKLSSQIGTKTTAAPQSRPSCQLVLNCTLFSIILARHPNSGGGHTATTGCRGNRATMRRPGKDSAGVNSTQQNKDASKVFGGDRHNWEEEEKEEKREQEQERRAEEHNDV